MPPTSGAVRASVSVEDISRQYYETAGYSMWITQMHVDPLELIVADDASGKLYRVPVQMGKGGAFEFGDAQEVAIEYKDVKTKEGSKAAASMPFRWATRDAAYAAAGVSEVAPGVLEIPGDNPGDYPRRYVTAGETPPEPKVERTLPPAEAIKKVASATATKTPDATPAAGQPDKAEEATNVPFDAAKYREAFGLPDSLSDDEVRAQALAALTDTPDTDANGGGTDAAALLASIPKDADAIVLDRANYQELVRLARKGDQAFEMMQRGQRDEFLKKAMTDGRFPPAKLAAYQNMWDKNPQTTREFVELMPKHSVPTFLSGGMGVEVDADQATRDYEAVYGRKDV
jgi:hypothetical protein